MGLVESSLHVILISALGDIDIHHYGVSAILRLGAPVFDGRGNFITSIGLHLELVVYDPANLDFSIVVVSDSMLLLVGRLLGPGGVCTPGSMGEYRGDEKVGTMRSPKGDQGMCTGREQETPKRDTLGQRSGGAFGNAKLNWESIKS